MQTFVAMDTLASRFWVMQHRYIEFSARVYGLLRTWLMNQSESCVEVSLDCLTGVLFGVEMDSWLRMVARCALGDQLSCIPYVQLGSSVVFNDIPATLGITWPMYSQMCVATRLPEDTVRNAVLEVRVLELETKMMADGLLPRGPKSSLPVTVAADATSFLLEKRFEAEDSIMLLRRMQTEFVGRKRAMDAGSADILAQHTERRQTEAKQARLALALASEEISRLRNEVDSLRSAMHPQKKARTVDNNPIVPRRALVLAGFWNVAPNDVLGITPHLVARFESASGIKVLQQAKLQVYFPAKDKAVLIRVVAEVMAEHLPHYTRVGGF